MGQQIPFGVTAEKLTPEGVCGWNPSIRYLPLAWAKRLLTSSQLTTFHQAAR